MGRFLQTIREGTIRPRAQQCWLGVQDSAGTPFEAVWRTQVERTRAGFGVATLVSDYGQPILVLRLTILIPLIID